MKQEVIESTECSITEEAVRSSATNIIPRGNVVIATRVGLGKVCLLGQDTAINQDLRSVIPRNGNLTVKFLFYWLRYIAPRIVAEGTGATVQGVKLPFIKSLLIPFLPVNEQERITAILDEAFEAIRKATSTIDAATERSQEVFETQLHRLIGRSGKGWRALTLAEVSSDYGRGKSKHRPRNDPKLYGGKYPFIQTGDIRNADQYVTTYSQTYSELGLAQSKLWPKGTLCITIAANIAETAMLSFDACFPDSVIGVVADPAVADPRFIEYQLRLAKAQLQIKGRGSAQDNINLGTFETYKFYFPPVATQRVLVDQLDSIVSHVNELISILDTKLRLLEGLRQSLLDQAFSGKL